MLSRSALARTGRTLSLRATPRSFSSSPAAREHFLNAGPELFEAHAVKGDTVTLVDFYADWCGPCRMLTPILKSVVTQTSGMNLMTINTDEQFELASRFKIAALPTVVAFKSGAVVGKFVGAKNEAGVRAFLEQVKKEADK